MERIVDMTPGFTPADIEYFFQQVAHFSFEQELASQADYLVTEETFALILPQVSPSLSKEILDEFIKDSVSYSRV